MAENPTKENQNFRCSENKDHNMVRRQDNITQLMNLLILVTVSALNVSIMKREIKCWPGEGK